MTPLYRRKHNIEWSQKSWNAITGCRGPKGDGVRCEGCYAYHIARYRIRGRYGYDAVEPFKPTFHENRLSKPEETKLPTVFFFCSMGDWLDDGVKSEWREQCLKIMDENRRHTFITLTKQYKNLWKAFYDSEPLGGLPSNVIIGISVTKREQVWGIEELKRWDARNVISFEPLLEDVSNVVSFKDIDWIIIGARTGRWGAPYFRPEKGWVQRLVKKARARHITIDGVLPATKVFLKPNLGDYVRDGWFPELIEELPWEDN